MAFRSLDDMYDKWDKTAKGVGNPDDAEVPSGDGSSIGILKAVRTMVSSALVTLGSAIGSKGQLVAGSDGANARAIKTSADGTVLTQLTGSNLEYYGATEGDRPAANSVPVGAMYMAVQPQKIWQSDGSDWVEVL